MKKGDPPINYAALGGGLGGALALLSLLALFAAAYRRLRKNKVDDLENPGTSSAVGATPIVPLGEAPNSIPPTGTN